jgi:Holliday junction DNA helicase RuvA
MMKKHHGFFYLRSMIAYLQGKVIRRSLTSMIIDCQGVGYEVRISLYTGTALEGTETVSLHIYHHFSQDHQALFGFSSEAERQLFVLLISVSGVGPNTAQLIQSYMSPQETEIAILGEDIVAFRKVKGVGEKTARRILIDLKDKIQKGSADTSLPLSHKDNRMEDEALSALLALGFPRVQAQKVLARIRQTGEPVSGVEALIRLALRELS